MNTIGGLIKDYRIQKNISQTQIAYKMGWKDSSQLSRIEQGKTKPSKLMISKIANVMSLNDVEATNLYLAGGYLPTNNEIEQVVKHNNDIVDNWKYPAMMVSLDWTIVYANKQANSLYKINKNSNLLEMLILNGDVDLACDNYFLNKLDLFKLAMQKYTDITWYKKLIARMVKNKTFKQYWSMQNHKKINDINFETVTVNKENKVLKFNIFRRAVLEDPRFFYEFYNPADAVTMNEYQDNSLESQ